MSWDIFIQDLPRDAKSIADIPDDFQPSSIGQRSDIVSAIQEVIPKANFSDPSWGIIEGDGWSIEVNIGDNAVCDCVALHVRGSDAAAGAVAAIIDRLGLRALDSQTGEFFVAGPEAVESFRKWRAYRNRTIGDG